MKSLCKRIRQSLGARRGISSVEYALLLAVIGSGIAIGAATLTSAISSEMEGAANCIKSIDTDCIAD